MKLKFTDRSTIIFNSRTFIPFWNIFSLRICSWLRISSKGKMIVGENTYNVEKGSIVLIPDGAFHKVWNTSPFVANDDLEFICVFDGGRNH